MNEQNQKVNVRVVKSDSFKQIYSIAAIGGHSQYDFRIAFLNESAKYSDDGKLDMIERTVMSEIVLPPRAAKELSMWLSQHVKVFEQTFGEINVGAQNKDKDIERKPLNYTSEVA